MLGVHAQIVLLAILLLGVVVIELGIHLRKESVQVHAVAVKDILIDFLCVVPVLGDCNLISVCFLILGTITADEICIAVIVDIIAVAVIGLVQLVDTTA